MRPLENSHPTGSACSEQQAKQDTSSFTSRQYLLSDLDLSLILSSLSVLLLAVGGCLAFGLSAGGVGPNPFNLGLGAVDPTTIITWSIPTDGTVGLVSNVV